MTENLSSEIDTLSGGVPETTFSETNEIDRKKIVSKSRRTGLNEMTQARGYYNWKRT